MNADSLEDVEKVFKAAAKYRQKFNQDVVIDLIGYRKMGHNELDQPSFTQPLMYQQVAKMTPVARIYEQEALRKGFIDQAGIDAMKQTIRDTLESAYLNSKNTEYKSEDWMNEEWAAIKEVDVKKQIMSGVDVSRVRETGRQIATLPQDENFHKLVAKIFEQRL